MRGVAALLCLCAVAAQQARGQRPDAAAIVAMVDQAVRMRLERLAGYTVTEHYAVYRGSEQGQPIAEMTVKTTYRRETGKSYEVLSESGPELVRSFGLRPLLERERVVNLPENREHFWFTSANYRMEPAPGTQTVNGRECYLLKMSPRQRAANLLNGTLWVDVRDGSIVRAEGVGTKNPSLLSGSAHMMREYAPMEGMAMGTHARAESESFLFGRVVVTIDYTNYELQVTGGR